MDDDRFDVFVLSLETGVPRRAALVGALGTGLASLLTRLGVDIAESRKKKEKKRKQKLKRNEFGCVDVGQPCRGNDANCCSGHCAGSAPKKGKKDTSTCIAHGDGGCPVSADACVAGQASCEEDGICFRTTGNASFCGKKAACEACTADTECEEAGFGAGAACIVCAVPCDKDGGTACVPAATPAES